MISKEKYGKLNKIKKYLISQVFLVFICSVLFSINTFAMTSGKYVVTIDLGHNDEYPDSSPVSYTMYPEVDARGKVTDLHKPSVKNFELADSYNINADAEFGSFYNMITYLSQYAAFFNSENCSDLGLNLANKLIQDGYMIYESKTINKAWNNWAGEQLVFPVIITSKEYNDIWKYNEHLKDEYESYSEVASDDRLSYKWHKDFREDMKEHKGKSFLTSNMGTIIKKGDKQCSYNSVLSDEKICEYLFGSSVKHVKIEKYDENVSSNYSWSIDESSVTEENKDKIEIVVKEKNNTGTKEIFRFYYDKAYTPNHELHKYRPTLTTENKYIFITHENAAYSPNLNAIKMFEVKGQNLDSVIPDMQTKGESGSSIPRRFAVSNTGTQLELLELVYDKNAEAYNDQTKILAKALGQPISIETINAQRQDIFDKKNIIASTESTVEKGDWIFTEDGTILKAEDKVTNRVLYFNLDIDSGIYGAFVKAYNGLDLNAKVSPTDQSSYTDVFSDSAGVGSTLFVSQNPKIYIGDKEINLGSIQNLKDRLVLELDACQKNNTGLFLVAYEINNNPLDDIKPGQDKNHQIQIKRDSAYEEAKGDVLFEYDVSDMLLKKYEDKIENVLDKLGNKSSSVVEGLMTGDEAHAKTDPALRNFMEAIMKYAKPILMFIVFLSLLYASFSTMINGQDPGKRALLKEKLMHIIIGIIFIAAAAFVIGIAESFFTASLQELGALDKDGTAAAFAVEDPTYEDNWLINIIAGVVDGLRMIFEWIVEKLLSALVSEGNPLDIGELIYNVDDMTLSPFTEIEWGRYMFGYGLLSSLAIALMVIAILKVAYELIIYAGNYEKIAETKQTILRIILAILGIALGPYLVRLMLMLFNYLVLMVPVDGVKLDISFADAGLIGAVANFLFIWVKFKIYLVFLVRKVMLTFMLLSTPFVFGVWAISNKFRSLGLWMGEIFTNAATQLCYALVFFIVILMSFEGQNEFISLLLVTMIMKLADFFKDSLQGLMQKWGGINETGIAESVGNQVKGWGSKPKQWANKAGGKMIGAAGYFDKDGTTKWGKRMHNTGSVLSGNVFNVRTERDRLSNLSNMARGDMNVAQGNFKFENSTVKASLDRLPQDSQANVYYNDVMSGNVDQQTMDTMGAKGGIYSSINNLHNTKKDYDDKVRLYQAASALKDNNSSFLSNLQQKSEDKAREEIANAPMPIDENYANPQSASGNAEAAKRNQEKIGKNFAKAFGDVCNSASDLAIEKERAKTSKVSPDSFKKSAKNLIDSCGSLADMDVEMGTNSSQTILKGLNDAENTLRDEGLYDENSDEAKKIQIIREKCSQNVNVTTRKVVEDKDTNDFQVTKVNTTQAEQADQYENTKQNNVNVWKQNFN